MSIDIINTSSKAKELIEGIYATSFAYSYLNEQDSKINELVRFLTESPSMEDIDMIMRNLIMNFTRIRLNATRFVQACNNNIFKVLFDLYLSFQKSPLKSILQCLEVLLINGCSDKHEFEWLFKYISVLIKSKEVTNDYLLNYMNILKYFYGYFENAKNYQKDNNSLLNYFYFFPSKNNNNGMMLRLQDSEISFSSGFAISTWFKFPYQINNSEYFKELKLLDKTVDIIKIPLETDRVISIKLIFNKNNNNSYLQLLDNNKSIGHKNISMANICHLILDITPLSIVFSLNSVIMDLDSKKTFSNKIIPLEKLTSMYFFNDFFGEVYSLILYPQTLKITESSKCSYQEQIQCYNEYCHNLLSCNNYIPPCLVYFPYAHYENVCCNYDNNTLYTLIPSKRGSGVYHHTPCDKIINQTYGLNCLLPLFEFIFIQRHNKDFHQEQLVIQFIEIFQMYSVDSVSMHIINNNLNQSFLFVLSMFIEKMPSTLFSELFWKKLFHILSSLSNEHSYLAANFAKYIILNENVLNKLPSSFNPWKMVSQMQQSSYPDLLNVIPLNLLLKFMLHYDKNRYSEFCCEYHLKAMTSNNKNQKIMRPALFEQIKFISSLIIKQCHIIVKQESISSMNGIIDQKDGGKNIRHLLHISRLISLKNSPCLVIKLFDIISNCLSSYEQRIIDNCSIALYSPFLDVKKCYIDLLIKKNIIPSTINIGQLIQKSIISYFPPNKTLLKDCIYNQDYLDKLYSNLQLTLLEWLLPLSNQKTITIVNNNSNKGKDKNQIEINKDFRALGRLLIENSIRVDNTLHSFFNQLLQMLIKNLNNLASKDIDNPKLTCNKNQFENKLFSLINVTIDDNPIEYCYIISIIIFHYTIINSSDIKYIYNHLQIILPVIFSSNVIIIQTIQFDFLIFSIIKNILDLSKKLIENNMEYSLNFTIDTIAIFFNYFIFSLKFQKEKGNKLSSSSKTKNKFQNPFGIFNASKSIDQSWSDFNIELINTFHCHWNKKEYIVNCNNYAQVIEIQLKAFDADVFYLQDQRALFTRVKDKKEGSCPLIIIISFIYINQLLKANDTQSVENIVSQYKKFIFFLIILSIADTTSEHDNCQSIFNEVFILYFYILFISPCSQAIKEFILILKYFCQWKNIEPQINLLWLDKQRKDIAIFNVINIIPSLNGSSPKEKDEENPSFYSKIQSCSENIIEEYEKYCNSFIMKRYAKAYQKKSSNTYNLIEKEEIRKQNVNFIMQKIDLDINTLYINERKKRRLYRSIKKYFFSWNRAWSNTSLFYDNKNMKLKSYLHYTKSFTCPFFIPILDVISYLPDIPNFEKEKLFYLGDDYAKNDLQLNINSILTDRDTISSINIIQQEIEEMNLLYDLYDQSDIYYTKQKQMKNDATSINPSQETLSCLKQIRQKANDDNTCCMIKSSHHIKGIFNIRLEKIQFLPFVHSSEYHSKHEDNDWDYDPINKACFNSNIPNFPKNKNRMEYEFAIDSITHIFQRKYYFKDTGIEIFFKNHKSYYFTFLTKDKRDQVYFLLKRSRLENIFTSEYSSQNELLMENVYSNWSKGLLSNMHFLMMINLGGNRSFNDLTQYPIFPWTITDFNTISIKEKDYRNLSLPIGMLEIESKPESSIRKKEFETSYASFCESNDEFMSPYYYGTFYSNPIFVVHYLNRIFPMALIMIDIQGGAFDVADRLFISIENSFHHVMTQKPDLRELIPQFYYLPDMFINQNNFNLGIHHRKPIGDVLLPQWANKDAFAFVAQMRRYLEDDYVSSHLHSWLDLIFGSKQRDKNAIAAKNLFTSSVYQDSFEINYKENGVEYYCRLAEFGLIPKQIFTNALDPKKKKINKFLKNSQDKNIDIFFESYVLKPLCCSHDLIFKLKYISSTKIQLIYSNGYIECLSYSRMKGSFEAYTELYGLKRLFSNKLDNVSLIGNKINTYESEAAIVIYNKGNNILQGGFYDGQLLLSTPTYMKFISTHSYSPVCTLAISQTETIILAGNLIGSIHYYNLEDKTQDPRYVCTINYHQGKISNIFISTELNAFASASEDNYVNICTLPNMTLIRSFKIYDCQFSFLSDSPLGSITIYTRNRYHCYSLNGSLLKNIEQANKMKHPRVIKDSSFFDYLIYLTSSNEIYIDSFPYMEHYYYYNLQIENSICYFDVEDNLKTLIIFISNKENPAKILYMK